MKNGRNNSLWQRILSSALTLLVASVLLLPFLEAESASAQSEAGAAHAAKLDQIQDSEGKPAAEAYYASLSDADRAALNDFLSAQTITGAVTIKEESQLNAQSSGCWTRTSWIRSKSSITGWLFWYLEQNISWCGNGVSTYSESCWTAVDYGSGWGFDGFIEQCGLVFDWGNTFKYVTQGQFSACWNWACPNSAVPWIQQQGAADGQYWRWSGS